MFKDRWKKHLSWKAPEKIKPGENRRLQQILKKNINYENEDEFILIEKQIP